ncbi:choline/carnitine O-acyltransferase [Salinispora pacifica]|uniref:choline/carnitine O-acyltransferase n=1 Tax=Salinispora pacifica TaxID=351187 RepID=UPI00036F03C8|nr:choline/carnitine O-acyltransferase [Salinispora pacifica]
MSTFENEGKLPSVPLPTLEETCARFLEWSGPLLTAQEFADTEAAVREFEQADGPGPKLHADLVRYNEDTATHSWLDYFWPARYLGRRDRIALNANFFFLFRDTPLRGFADPQVERAVRLIAATVNYKVQLDAERIPPAVTRGQPLSMEQNKFLFSTTRIPGPTQDSVRAPYSAEMPGPATARHIVVFCHGNAFRMDVLGPDGRPYSLDDLAAGLRELQKAGLVPAAMTTAAGHLTTMARAEWAAARQRLVALDPSNAAALEAIETALFCVCLEDLTPADDLAACDQLLHGDSGNRWFDKAVSLIVFADGTAGINVEHCELDGTTILSFVDTILAGTPEEHAAQSGAVAQGVPAIEPVTFVLDDGLQAEIGTAAQSFAQFGADTATVTLPIDEFGVDEVKRLRMSPDAFVQLGYQLAHKRAKGFTGATYESIATRQYSRGRTEAMRVVTPEVLRFVAVMDDPAAAREERRAAFRAAADKHVERAKQCQAGAAPEQHLWELQLIQQRRGAELGVPESPRLYETPGWRTMRDDYLSTSSAPSTKIRYFGFGATSSRCIGIAYVLLPDRFQLYLSTPRPVAEMMHTFADRLREALRELRALLDEQ